MLVLVIVLVVAAFALVVFDARRGATRARRAEPDGTAQDHASPNRTTSGRATPKRSAPGRSSPRTRGTRAHKNR
ncbi:MAG: hypothetical protein ABSA65_03770 [Acidimicrobiales bacterium]